MWEMFAECAGHLAAEQAKGKVTAAADVAFRRHTKKSSRLPVKAVVLLPQLYNEF
jgi:hypothetical protein